MAATRARARARAEVNMTRAIDTDDKKKELLQSLSDVGVQMLKLKQNIRAIYNSQTAKQRDLDTVLISVVVEELASLQWRLMDIWDISLIGPTFMTKLEHEELGKRTVTTSKSTDSISQDLPDGQTKN